MRASTEISANGHTKAPAPSFTPSATTATGWISVWNRPPPLFNGGGQGLTQPGITHRTQKHIVRLRLVSLDGCDDRGAQTFIPRDLRIVIEKPEMLAIKRCPRPRQNLAAKTACPENQRSFHLQKWSLPGSLHQGDAKSLPDKRICSRSERLD